MMPACDKNSDSAQPAKVYLLEMKEILTLDSKREEERHISDIVEVLNNSKVLSGASNYKSCDIDQNIDANQVLKSDDDSVSLRNYANLNECCKDNSDIPSNMLSLKISDTFTDRTLRCNQSAQFKKYSKKSFSELNSLSLKELHILLEDLSQAVEAVSGKLVQLLLENDALQQESDARNIAIEQLLHLAVKNTDNELRPIQMSVILPSEERDAS